MSYRFMRVIVLFDLPMETSADQKEYRSFRKYLIKNGFLMLQKSVYCKLTLNTSIANRVMNNIKKESPPNGLVQMLMVTERQYSKMEYVIGESTTEVLNDDRRLVVF